MRARIPGLVLSVLWLAGVAGAQEPPLPSGVSSAQAAVSEGIALLKQNKRAQARERFERALALDPASAAAHYMLGWVREQERDLAAAEREYEAALVQAPSRAEIHDRLGFVRGEQGRTEEALAGFRKAVSLDPKLFDARYHLGATLW